MSSSHVDSISASHLHSLHKAGQPLVLTNVWDLASLRVVLSLNPGSGSAAKPIQAVATASWAVAASLGIRDEDLTLDQNLAAIKALAPVVRAAGLPLSVDLQDGYGPRIREATAAVIAAGAVGANIEDTIEGSSRLYSLDEQVDRIRTALSAAAEAGCPDFVLNARCDVLYARPKDPGPDLMAETIRRGRAYLDAGATAVFVWGGSGRGIRNAEVEQLTKALGGRLSVKLGLTDDALSVQELGEIGVCRVSVGPSLYMLSMMAMREAAGRIVSGGTLRGQDGRSQDDFMSALMASINRN